MSFYKGFEKRAAEPILALSGLGALASATMSYKTRKALEKAQRQANRNALLMASGLAGAGLGLSSTTRVIERKRGQPK